MSKNKSKVYNAILFFLEKSAHPTLGKVKLAKLLFFTDALAYHSTGRTITDEEYIKLPLGPVPENFDLILSSMENDGLIEKRIRPTLKKDQETYFPCMKINFNVFLKKEIAIMSEVIDIFRNKYTDELVELSHKLLPWDIIEVGEQISFELFGMDCEEAQKLKMAKEKLSTSEIILNSPKLISDFRRGRKDVEAKRIKEHKWH
jgi:uncharacterized phage-associated protein